MEKELQINTICVLSLSIRSYAKDLLVKHITVLFAFYFAGRVRLWELLGEHWCCWHKIPKEGVCVSRCLFLPLFLFFCVHFFPYTIWKQKEKATKPLSGWLYWCIWSHFYLRRDTTVRSSMDVCTLKIEKKSELWKRSDQQLWGLKACIHSVNWTQALTVCPPSLPSSLPLSPLLRCSSSLLEKSLQVRICTRSVPLSKSSPTGALVPCGWEDVKIYLEGNNLKEFDLEGHGFSVTARPELFWTSRGWYFTMHPKPPSLNTFRILLPYPSPVHTTWRCFSFTYGGILNS